MQQIHVRFGRDDSERYGHQLQSKLTCIAMDNPSLAGNLNKSYVSYHIRKLPNGATSFLPARGLPCWTFTPLDYRRGLSQ